MADDHDQRLKTLLKIFLPEFYRVFRAEWAAHLDFATVEWLEQEIFPDPPKGVRRAIDLVAKVRATRPIAGAAAGQEHLALLHIEVEAEDSVEPLRRRMYDYYKWLRDKHRRLVLPLAVYLDVGLNGLGWDEYQEEAWGETLVTFRYPYIGLPALDAEQHLGSGGIETALVALMKIPAGREKSLKEEAVRRILEGSADTWQKGLLVECVQAYLPLGETLDDVFARLVDKEPYMGTRKLGLSWREEGELKALQRLLLTMLEKKFGPLPLAARARLLSWPASRLEEVGAALLQAGSLDDLGLGDSTNTTNATAAPA
jgi:hypothetical protein